MRKTDGQVCRTAFYKALNIAEPRDEEESACFDDAALAVRRRVYREMMECCRSTSVKHAIIRKFITAHMAAHRGKRC